MVAAEMLRLLHEAEASSSRFLGFRFEARRNRRALTHGQRQLLAACSRAVCQTRSPRGAFVRYRSFLATAAISANVSITDLYGFILEFR